MASNIGNLDRILRLIGGLALLSLLFVLPDNARWWGLAGLVPLATVATSWCPGYALFGLSTGPKKKS